MELIDVHSHISARQFDNDREGVVQHSLDSGLLMILDSGDGRNDGNGAYIKPSSHLSPHEGTVYFTAGSSGKTSGGSLDHPVMYISHNKLGSVILDIEGYRADITFIDNNEDSLDYLTLFKGPPVWSD